MSNGRTMKPRRFCGTLEKELDMKQVTFEVCDCGASHKHGYFHVDGNVASPSIYSVPWGREKLADIVASEGLSDNDVASAKAQLEAAGLQPELLEHEIQMATLPTTLDELRAMMDGLGARGSF